MNIKTNNKPYELKSWSDLSDKARAEFDYITVGSDDAYTSRFVQYKGVWYDTNEFQGFNHIQGEPWFKGWDGYQSDTYFSGVVLRWYRERWRGELQKPDFERVVMGTYFS